MPSHRYTVIGVPDAPLLAVDRSFLVSQCSMQRYRELLGVGGTSSVINFVALPVSRTV